MQSHLDRYEEAIRATREAGRVALQYFDTGVAVETKADDSPVTIADRSAEETLRGRLIKHFPDDGFLGEEFGNSPGTSGYRWIIDPIDGTRSFIRGIPLWATLVGLEYQGEMVAGLAFNPVLDQMHHAMKGSGAFRDDRPIHVSNTATLNRAIVAYSSIDYFKAAGRQQAWMDLLGAAERSRSYCDYYGFVLVAQGSVDLMADHGVHIWDVAGLKVIVEEAGGKFSDWSGQPSVDRPDVLASNGRVHAGALLELNRRA